MKYSFEADYHCYQKLYPGRLKGFSVEVWICFPLETPEIAHEKLNEKRKNCRLRPFRPGDIHPACTAKNCCRDFDQISAKR